MGICLIASVARGLFIAMLVIMIVVCVLFGLMMFMLFKPSKKNGDSDSDSVKKLLSRRETSLTVELMNNKENEEKRGELIHKLRRVKSAQLLIDELLADERAIESATEAEEKERAKKAKAEKARAKENREKEPKDNPEVKPEVKPDETGDGAENKAETPAESKVEEKQPKPKKVKPAKKKKDDMEFKPSDD